MERFLAIQSNLTERPCRLSQGSITISLTEEAANFPVQSKVENLVPLT
jgi:hypothetical protein